MGPTTAAPTTTPSTTPATTTAAPTTAAPTTAAPSTTTPTTTVLPELVKKEIEQASEYMGTLNEAFDNGNLQQNMLDMDAFSRVTEVKLVAELNVQKADTDTPTQLLGTCQLSGLRLSDFQDAQRDAFDADRDAIMQSLGMTDEPLPLVWTADFIFGPKDADGNDSFVVGEFNCSCVGITRQLELAAIVGRTAVNTVTSSH